MRFLSVVYALLCLPLMLAAIVMSPVLVPAIFALALIVPGLSACHRTNSKRILSIAAFHSPHSLTWRWLVHLSLGKVFSRPRLYMSPKPVFEGIPAFVTFVFNAGFAGASATTNNYGWQFGAWMFGVHIRFSQQRPMWYRNMIHQAWEERDALVRENSRLRSQLSLVSHNAARASLANETAAHLN